MVFNLSWFSLNDPSQQFDPGTERTVPGIAQELHATFMGLSADAVFSSPESLILDGRPAMRFTGTSLDKAITVLVLDLGHDEIGFVGLMAYDPGEAAQFEPTLFAFAETLTYRVKPHG